MNIKKHLESGHYDTPYKVYLKIRYRIRRKKLKEKKNVKLIRGTNPERTIYIIRRASKSGFFSNFFFVLGHIIYASNQGYDVAVDMKNYPTLYSEKQKIEGTKNAWEYYFEQPDGISLKDAYKHKNVVLSGVNYQIEYVPGYTLKNYNPLTDELCKTLEPYVDRYIRIHPELIAEADLLKSTWGENVLGVHIRGTDMNCSYNHPVPASVETYIKHIDDVLKTQTIDKIFCCTDEDAILRQLQHKYGELIVCTDALKSINGQAIHTDKSIKRTAHKYQLGKEVLIDALLLSKCEHLIHGCSNVPYAAIVLNKSQYKTLVFVAPK